MNRWAGLCEVRFCRGPSPGVMWDSEGVWRPSWHGALDGSWMDRLRGEGRARSPPWCSVVRARKWQWGSEGVLGGDTKEAEGVPYPVNLLTDEHGARRGQEELSQNPWRSQHLLQSAIWNFQPGFLGLILTLETKQHTICCQYFLSTLCLPRAE